MLVIVGKSSSMHWKNRLAGSGSSWHDFLGIFSKISLTCSWLTGVKALNGVPVKVCSRICVLAQGDVECWAVSVGVVAGWVAHGGGGSEGAVAGWVVHGNGVLMLRMTSNTIWRHNTFDARIKRHFWTWQHGCLVFCVSGAQYSTWCQKWDRSFYDSKLWKKERRRIRQSDLWFVLP
jgi:hypothetical protein